MGDATILAWKYLVIVPRLCETWAATLTLLGSGWSSFEAEPQPAVRPVVIDKNFAWLACLESWKGEGSKKFIRKLAYPSLKQRSPWSEVVLNFFSPFPFIKGSNSNSILETLRLQTNYSLLRRKQLSGNSCKDLVEEVPSISRWRTPPFCHVRRVQRGHPLFEAQRTEPQCSPSLSYFFASQSCRKIMLQDDMERCSLEPFAPFLHFRVLTIPSSPLRRCQYEYVVARVAHPLL